MVAHMGYRCMQCYVGHSIWPASAPCVRIQNMAHLSQFVKKKVENGVECHERRMHTCISKNVAQLQICGYLSLPKAMLWLSCGLLHS